MLTLVRKSLRDRRTSTLAWSAGMVALVTLIFLYWPTVRGNVDIDRFLRELPEAVRALTGHASFATPVGFLNGELFSLTVPLLLLVVAIGLGARAIAGEEERGTLELLLTAPVSRRRVLGEKVLAALVILSLLGAVLSVALVVGAQVTGMHIPTGRLVAIAFSAVALSLPFGALALALGCATGTRGAAIGPTVTVAVAAYLLDTLAPLSPALRPYRVLSPFDWYGSEAVLASGARWGHLALLVGTAAVLAAVAAVAFERRDVG